MEAFSEREEVVLGERERKGRLPGLRPGLWAPLGAVGSLWGLWAPLDGGSCHTVEYHCPATRHTHTHIHTNTHYAHQISTLQSAHTHLTQYTATIS